MNRAAIVSVVVHREEDILLARQRARQISQFLGFSVGDVTRITTALSEIARNAFEYGGGGRVAFSLETTPEGRQELAICVNDSGPGIADVAAVLAPEFSSHRGMGIGIRGSRALMDRLRITSTLGGGTTVVMAKLIPRLARTFGPAEIAGLIDALARARDATPVGELQFQNQTLLATLDELTQRQAEIERLGAIAESARARAEEAQEVAERSLVVRERFMALTTHELRTPLNAIIGYLELLETELAPALSETQAGYLARVQRAAKHLAGVTDDFLDMAQGDAGRLTVQLHAGAARHVMTEAAALVMPQAAARDVTVSLAETADRVMYLGDVARVRQVLVNMLGNAVSFTPAGGSVRVVAARVERAPSGSPLSGGPWCAIRVEDTGPGIPADKLAHVFEPFVQLTGNGHAARKGSGLGLTVSRQLAVRMGGELTAASGGAGAVFTLWLPDGSVPAAPMPAPERMTVTVR